jgi:hypothetical protein
LLLTYLLAAYPAELLASGFLLMQTSGFVGKLLLEGEEAHTYSRADLR